MTIAILRLVLALAGLLFAAATIGAFVRAIKRKSVPIRGGTADRRTSPGSYWLVVVLLFLTAALITPYTAVLLVEAIEGLLPGGEERYPQ